MKTRDFCPLIEIVLADSNVYKTGTNSILKSSWMGVQYGNSGNTKFQVPYARHYNRLVIRNRSWILTIHKARILRKKPLEKSFLDLKKWVKSIQTEGYNGRRTVLKVQKIEGLYRIIWYLLKWNDNKPTKFGPIFIFFQTWVPKMKIVILVDKSTPLTF